VFLPLTINAPVVYAVLWLLLFLAGYVQWFVLLPKLTTQRPLTLGLSQNPENTQPLLKTDEPKSVKRTKPPTSAWDEAGLTPLERVMKEL
jgi:hypothetical protein